jgi:hypothetical protein
MALGGGGNGECGENQPAKWLSWRWRNGVAGSIIMAKASENVASQ